jgi:hypothetical protein
MVMRMGKIEVLQEELKKLERESEYSGYYFKMWQVLTIAICGMLCKLETIKDIILWSESETVKQFLLEQFQIVHIIYHFLNTNFNVIYV